MCILALEIRPFEACDQSAARRLIIEGLGGHFGFIDETRNPDLNDIAVYYQGETFVVAYIGPELVGTGALITEDEKTGRLVRMSVCPQYRRRGIGRTLVGHLLLVARQRGFGRVVVETNHDWEDAVTLYRHCDFVEYARDEVSVYMARPV